MKTTNRIALPFIAALAATLLASGCCGKYKDEITGLKDEMAKLKGEMARTSSDYEAKIGDLTEYQKALETQLEKLGVDRKKLMADYSAAQSDLEAKQKLIAEIMKKEEQARKRLEMLNSMLGKFKKMIETGKLKVKVKNNKMVLELPSAVLFDSGKADLKEEIANADYPAIRLLERQGFSFCGYNDRYYANQDIAIFFVLNLC